MLVNSSVYENTSICFRLLLLPGGATPARYFATVTTCIVNIILSPVAVAGNSLVLAAIWRNPCLRTPSYVLLSGLALVDLCTGLLTQPSYVAFSVADLMDAYQTYCSAKLLAVNSGLYFSSTSMCIITVMSIERWLYMSRRSVLTVRRVRISLATLALLPVPYIICRMWIMNGNFYYLRLLGSIMYFALGILCLFVIALAYFNIYIIIRHHQRQVQTNLLSRPALNLKKFKNLALPFSAF